MKRMPDWLAAPVRFIRRIASFRVPLYAANASFYLVLSVFPAILLVLALLPHTGLTEAHLLSALHGVIPSVFEPALEWVIRDLGSNSSLTLISVSAIMAIWSSSRGVYCIKTGLNAIYGERESRGYVYTRLVSVLYTVLLLAALLLTLVLHVFGSQLTAWIAGKHVPILRLLSRVLRFRGLVLFALLTLLFWAILCVFPNRRIPLLRALPGAAGCLARLAGVFIAVLRLCAALRLLLRVLRQPCRHCYGYAVALCVHVHSVLRRRAQLPAVRAKIAAREIGNISF